MKIYTVINRETGYSEEFYNLRASRAAMKANNAIGFITEIRSNGDFINHGQIKLKGNNKTFTANTKQVNSNY
jgi:hypothetical protein